jgi:hypothetical protein
MLKKLSLSLTVFMLTLTILMMSPVKSTFTTSIFVEPETCNVAGVGQTFTINITVANVTNLWGWEFKLFYDSIQLNGTALVEGPFLQTAGETFFWEVNFTDNYNATHGYVYAFCVLTHVIPGANGNGTIAKITFKSMAPGTSVLHLTETKLKNSGGDYIPHQTYDGTVIVKKPGDANGDGVVDAKDLRALMQSWPPAPYNPNSDFNDDSVIDAKDLRILGLHWESDP